VSVVGDPKLEALLAGLHAQSDAQALAMQSFDAERTSEAEPPSPREARAFLRDKLVALDADKAEFCYQLCRANNARRIVEIGQGLRIAGRAKGASSGYRCDRMGANSTPPNPSIWQTAPTSRARE